MSKFTNQRVVFFLSIGLLGVGVSAQTASSLVVPAAADDSSHAVVMEIVHGKPFVSVTINGQGPFRFVVDTGTGGEAFVTPELAAQLTLPHAGQITLNDPSGQGGRKVPLVRLDSLELGGVSFHAVRAAVHTLSPADGPCQGLLGFALFRNYLLTLDYPNRRLELAIGSLQLDESHSVLPMRILDGIPVVTLAIGAERIDAQIDSGGSGLTLPIQLTGRLKFASDYSAVSTARSLSTRFLLTGATLANDVHLGAYTFKHPFVEINPAFPLANFGSGPMQPFVLTFDQKNLLVRFRSAGRMLHLSAAPVPLRLETGPDRSPAEPGLVPTG
jgi:predicted aspartyl protease